MIPKNTGDSILNFWHHPSKKYLGGMIAIGIVGGILGILCGSIIIFSGFLIVGAIGKLWIDHNQKINR
jgi:hypothetical protein